MTRVTRLLPFGLGRIIAPNLLGFAVINCFTFSVDLALLTFCRGVAGWPLPVSVTASYVLALALNYALNRVFNFRSRRPIGSQVVAYSVVVTANYLVWILGLVAALAAVGVDYRLARISAGGCEAVFLYAAMRWWVFREVGDRAADVATAAPAGSAGARG